jgi:hypothetical protein
VLCFSEYYSTSIVLGFWVHSTSVQVPVATGHRYDWTALLLPAVQLLEIRDWRFLQENGLSESYYLVL